MLSRIKAILSQNGFILYTRPYELNIVGLRSDSTNSNRFDDEIHVFYKNNNGGWAYHVFPATTDPGTFWLNNPEYPGGTAILAQGQYVNAYQLGLHRGKYRALVQRSVVNVIRDYDRDAILDFQNGARHTGIFGINIHRADSSGSTKYINKYSAGCQVFQNAFDFDQFIGLCENHGRLYGNSFTYTLIDLRSIRRVTLRRIFAATSVIAALLLGWKIKESID